jgi:hypothetical protein
MPAQRAKTKRNTPKTPAPQAPQDRADVELTPELREEISGLNREAVAPRQIARRTGLPPSVVLEVLREVMEAEYHGPEAHAIVGCWVNAGWSRGLTVPEEYRAMDQSVTAGYGSDGLVSVTVARREPQGMLKVCQYLLDVFCLGVKNTAGPVVITEDGLDNLLAQFYQSYPEGYLAIPGDLAVELVRGALEYAAGLGFTPAVGSDWRSTGGHLDERSESPRIQFGRDGKPFYVNGPYDNADQVIKTLSQRVGKDGFDYAIGLGSTFSRGSGR